MHLNRLDLNLLVSLDALLTEKNVTKAGKRLYLSQPAMSGALQRLREYFDDELLVRVGRNMELTPRAQYLAEPVRDILLRIQETLDSQPEFDPSDSSREFSVIMSDYVAFAVMPAVNRILAKQAPGITLHIDERLTEAPQLLSVRETDLVILPPDVVRFDTDLTTVEPLLTDNWVCAVWEDNPQVGAEMSLETYLESPHILLRSHAGVRATTVEELRLQALGLGPVEVAHTAPGFAYMLFLLPGTSSIAMVQERLAFEFSRILPIKYVKPPIPIPPVELQMYYIQRTAFDPAHLWLRQLFLAAAATVQETDDSTKVA